MFCNCGDLARKLAYNETELAAFQKQLGYLEEKIDLLMKHLKLEFNDIPATERKRVIEKLGTNAKKPKEYNPYLNALKQDLQMRGLSPSCACRGSFPEPGAIHSVFNCKSKT